jgi:hypothetical protein
MQTAVNEALSSITTGIKKGFEQSSILVAGSKIYWNAEGSETAKVVVVDASGRIMLDKMINGQESVLINQPAGIYIYTFEQDGKTIASGKLGLAKLSYE